MPSQVRIISRPNRDYDDHIRRLIDEDGYGVEREWFGVATRERADEVRRGLKTAGRHLGVSVKAFWNECQGCDDGGDACAYHVKFTAYHPDRAREYMARKARSAEH